MRISIRRAAVAGVAGVAVAAGGGIAIAQGTQDDRTQERQAFLAGAAKRLGTTPERVESALRGAREDRLAAAVKAGRLTQEQADAIERRGAGGPGGGFGFGPGRDGGPGHPHGGASGHGPGPFGGPAALMRSLDEAAGYLGVSAQALRTALRDGKSLADVAKAQDKDVSGLEAVLRKAARDRLDAAVQAKRLTRAQADRFAAELDEHLGDLVAGALPGPAGGHGPGAPGPRPPRPGATPPKAGATPPKPGATPPKPGAAATPPKPDANATPAATPPKPGATP